MSPSLNPASSFSVRNHDRRRFRVGEQELGEFRREVRFLFVELPQRRFVRVGELRAGAHERPVVALEQIRALRVEAEGVALLVERLDPRVELRVQEDRVLVRGELRGFFRPDLLHRLVRVRLREIEEDLRDARQQLAGALHRLDRVRKGRRRGVVRDRLDLGDLPFHPFFDRRPVVGVVDLVERRRLVLKGASLEEGVGVRRAGAGREQEPDGNREKCR